MTGLDSDAASLRRPSPRLTFEDAVEVWKRYILGESQIHIAQAFGVNQSRIAEILNEKRHVGSHSAAMDGVSGDYSSRLAPLRISVGFTAAVK